MTTSDDMMDEPSSILGLIWPVAAVGAVLVLLAPFVFGVEHVRGVAIGSGLAALNLAAIAFVVRGVMRGAMLSWGSLAGLKFAVLVFLIWMVLRNDWAGVLPLALGYAALPLGIVVGQLMRAANPRREG